MVAPQRRTVLNANLHPERGQPEHVGQLDRVRRVRLKEVERAPGPAQHGRAAEPAHDVLNDGAQLAG
jgi:hypothetical protein